MQIDPRRQQTSSYRGRKAAAVQGIDEQNSQEASPTSMALPLFFLLI
jgi:hypothetical protein